MDKVVITGFLRDYRRSPRSDRKCACCEGGQHRTYRGVLHDVETDEEARWRSRIAEALRDIPEGNVVKIVVIDMGERCDLADDPFVLVRDGVYGPLSQLGGE